MHTINRLVVGLGLFLAMLIVGTAASAGAGGDKELPEFQLPSYDVKAIGTELELPVPVTIVNPIVGRELVGAKVTMTFRISKDGHIGYIRSNASRFDDQQVNLASVMAYYLRAWEFNPAMDKDGNAVAVKLRMPVEVVSDAGGIKEHTASIELGRSTIVAVAQW